MPRALKGPLTSAIVAVAGMSLLLVGLAAAQETGAATVTVTAAAVTIDVTDAAAGLGEVEPSLLAGGNTSDATGTGDDIAYVNPTASIEYDALWINAEQNGTSDPTAECNFGDPAATDWQLVDAMTGAADVFTLSAYHDDDALSSPTPLTADNNFAEIANFVPADGSTHNVDFMINLSSITTRGVPCTIDITLTAVG